MRHIAPALLLILSAGPAPAVGVPSLPKEINDVRWNVSSTVFGDFTCQGRKDIAMYGISEKSGFVVMIQSAQKNTKPSYLVFSTRDRDPKNLRLIVESLDFGNDAAFKEELKYSAPDLQPSKTCKGLGLGDGETDAQHIYWNRSRKRFESWSL